MSRHRLTALIAVLVVACGVIAGCTPDSGVNTETIEPATSTRTAPLSEAVSPPPGSAAQSSVAVSPSTIGATDQGSPSGEAADRAAVESQWIKSWDVYLAIATTPAADREPLIATVAIDPTKSNMLNDAAKFDAQGLQTYGSLGHRISWPQPINDASTALIDDCQDASQTGSMNVATGNKITAGVPRDHYQGNLVKGDDGVWRVAEVYYLKDEPC
jgi:hypothetical protein